MSINNPNSPAGKSDLGQTLKGTLPGEAGERLEGDLGAAEETVRKDLDEIKRQAADDVRNLTEEAKGQIGAASEKAKSFAADQKDLAAGQLSGVASAMTKVADELGQDQPTVARYARDMAQGIERLSDRVKNRDVDDLMSMAQDFGRSQPVAFLGIAALAGFMASRFALSSAHRREENASGEGRFGGDQSKMSTQSVPPSYGDGSGAMQSGRDYTNGRH